MELCLLSCSLSFLGMKVKQDQNSKQAKARELLKKICAGVYISDGGNSLENEEISQLIFVAAKIGNVEFLIEFIRIKPDLIWKKDTEGRTIFHIAVQERHDSIFCLLNELGSIKNLILGIITNNGNNMLHLAAKLAPKHKLNAISGAALQMQQELLWFKVLIHILCLELVSI